MSVSFWSANMALFPSESAPWLFAALDLAAVAWAVMWLLDGGARSRLGFSAESASEPLLAPSRSLSYGSAMYVSPLLDGGGASGLRRPRRALAGALLACHAALLLYTSLQYAPASLWAASLAALSWLGICLAEAFAAKPSPLGLPPAPSSRAARAGVLLSSLTCCVYAVVAVQSLRLFASGSSGASSPFERRAQLAGTAALALLAEAYGLLLLLDSLRALGDVGGAGADVERGAESFSGRAPQRRRSWVSLLGVAAGYMWPREGALRVRAVACVGLIGVLRLLNLAVPWLYKRVVDEFAEVAAATHPPAGVPARAFAFMEVFWPYVLLYLTVYFFQGGTGAGSVGLVSNLRSWLWIPIGQASYRKASLDIFSHTLGMDMQWHLHRRTGEVLRIMDRGTSSIQTMLSTIVFSIGPSVFDIVAASVYIAISLKPWIAVIVFVTLSSYIPMTVYLTEWRGQFRRDMNRLENALKARAADALLNYETVKLFGNEGLERRTVAAAMDAYLREDYRLQASMTYVNVAQSLVISLGLIAGLVVCTQGIADGSLTVGDVVLFVTLIQQLYAPLNFFGTYYRMIQQAMIDMENMFDLMAQHSQLQDAPDAKALAPAKYSVQFQDVVFAYGAVAAPAARGKEGRGEGEDGAPNAPKPPPTLPLESGPVLRGVSFEALPGTTLALVGATGSGKSTLLRLLFRFYDTQGGAIRVGDVDTRSVTQASLRACMGVVPQDTVLFNDTLRANIRYARPQASDAEVEAAARSACLHDDIQARFPLGYDTQVGERGLRLSGGEKQRVAFARAILRNPPILVLDEATSALDSLTERRIQASLAEARADRTVLIVAHRLSTVRDADQLVVLRQGRVHERGTHDELLQRQGLYADMWERQKGGAAEEAEGPATGDAADRPPSRLRAARQVVDEEEQAVDASPHLPAVVDSPKAAEPALAPGVDAESLLHACICAEREEEAPRCVRAPQAEPQEPTRASGAGQQAPAGPSSSAEQRPGEQRAPGGASGARGGKSRSKGRGKGGRR